MACGVYFAEFFFDVLHYVQFTHFQSFPYPFLYCMWLVPSQLLFILFLHGRRVLPRKIFLSLLLHYMPLLPCGAFCWSFCIAYSLYLAILSTCCFSLTCVSHLEIFSYCKVHDTCLDLKKPSFKV